MAHREVNENRAFAGTVATARVEVKCGLGEELDDLFRAVDALEKEVAQLTEQIQHVTREPTPSPTVTKEHAAPPEAYRSPTVDNLRVQRRRIVALTDRLNDVRTRLDV